MKPQFRLACFASVVLFAALPLIGYSNDDRSTASSTAREMYDDSRAAMANAWEKVKLYGFNRRDDFNANAQALTAEMDARISRLRADYSEARASASRRAAMEELKNSEADYKEKLGALGRATAATWDSAKQNVIAAWNRLQASYQRARAD